MGIQLEHVARETAGVEVYEALSVVFGELGPHGAFDMAEPGSQIASVAKQYWQSDISIKFS